LKTANRLQIFYLKAQKALNIAPQIALGLKNSIAGLWQVRRQVCEYWAFKVKTIDAKKYKRRWRDRVLLIHGRNFEKAIRSLSKLPDALE